MTTPSKKHKQVLPADKPKQDGIAFVKAPAKQERGTVKSPVANTTKPLPKKG